MGDNIIDCICALTIFVLSYWLFLTRKDVRRPISKLFLYVLVMGTLSCVFNLGCGIMDSRPDQYALGFREVIHGLYLVTHSLVAPFMAGTSFTLQESATNGIRRGKFCLCFPRLF